MNWTTLYITGKSDFRREVLDKLDDSQLDFMPGYVDGTSGSGIYDLYWIRENSDLREVKNAIGSKLIWKYRLRFFCDLEEFLESVNQTPSVSDLSEEDKNLLTAMRKSA
jgi:hypothetical protein